MVTENRDETDTQGSPIDRETLTAFLQKHDSRDAVTVDVLRPGVTRAASVEAVVGGKGVNVTRQLRRLHIPSLATGVWGGEIGQMLDRLLADAPRYAEALKMRLVEGVPRVECADRLGVTPPTFDVVLFRATRAFEREWSRS